MNIELPMREGIRARVVSLEFSESGEVAVAFSLQDDDFDGDVPDIKFVEQVAPHPEGLDATKRKAAGQFADKLEMLSKRVREL